MARAQKLRSTPDLGQAIGEALGEGIAEALEKALAQVREELAPLSSELLDLLRVDARRIADDLAASAADEARLAASFGEDGLRRCGEAGCERRAIARGLCRKHYARTVYQERKARKTGEATPVVARRRARPALDEGAELEKKTVAAVAPIVRRKKSDGTPDVPAPQPMAAAANGGTPPVAATPPPPPAGVTADSIARLWGLK